MSHLDTILALQQALASLHDAQRRLDAVPDWMSELHAEHAERLAEIEAEEATVAEAERAQREAEAAHQDAQAKLAHYQQQISQVTNQREYGALLKEIDTVKALIRDAEETTVSAGTTAEEAGGRLTELREQFQDLDQRHQAEMTKWESEKPGVEKEAAKWTQEVETLHEKMPRPYLSLFNRIFDRTGGQATAEVSKIQVRKSSMWHCSGCHYNVRPQIVVEIRNGELHQCNQCKRFLSLPPAEEEQAAEA